MLESDLPTRGQSEERVVLIISIAEAVLAHQLSVLFPVLHGLSHPAIKRQHPRFI